mgnify:CR=1 FL=1
MNISIKYVNCIGYKIRINNKNLYMIVVIKFYKNYNKIIIIINKINNYNIHQILIYNFLNKHKFKKNKMKIKIY